MIGRLGATVVERGEGDGESAGDGPLVAGGSEIIGAYEVVRTSGISEGTGRIGRRELGGEGSGLVDLDS